MNSRRIRDFFERQEIRYEDGLKNFPSCGICATRLWHVQSYTLAAMQIASGYETERRVVDATQSLSSTYLLSRRSADCVEKIFAASVLCRAVEDLYKFQDERRDEGQVLYRNVSDWMASNDRSSPYSFLNLCDALGLAPDRLRGELLAANPPSKDEKMSRTIATCQKPDDRLTDFVTPDFESLRKIQEIKT